MAGFNDNQNGSPVFQRIRESVKSLSNFGMRYGDMVIKNSQAIGAVEAEFKGGHQLLTRRAAPARAGAEGCCSLGGEGCFSLSAALV